MTMTTFLTSLLATVCLGLAGCRTSPVAIELADEQLKVIQAAQKASEAYGATIIQFAEDALVAFKNEATRDFEDRKALQIKTNQDRAALASSIEKAKGDLDAELARLDDNFLILRNKTTELTQVWSALESAQSELRRYLVTERIDQKLASMVSVMLKLDQAQLELSLTTTLNKASVVPQ